jgi:hypothetical protein
MELQLVICNSSAIPFSWANQGVLKLAFPAFLDITPSRVACLVIWNSSTRKGIKPYSSYAKPSSLVRRRVFIETRYRIPRSLSDDAFHRFGNVPVYPHTSSPFSLGAHIFKQIKLEIGLQEGQGFGGFSFNPTYIVLRELINGTGLIGTLEATFCTTSRTSNSEGTFCLLVLPFELLPVWKKLVMSVWSISQ